MNTPLITKFRPISFDEVMGNKVVVKALEEAIKDASHPHAFLFTGHTGVGKTTLARIIATKINASLEEISAGTDGGIDEMRRLVDRSGIKPIWGNPYHLVIIDECHALTKAAWSSLLVLLEEPPPHLYFALCTTEANKVPEAIKGRCYSVTLKKLKLQELSDLLILVCEVEQWTVQGDVFNAITVAADGSARKALSILHAGHAVANAKELYDIIETVEAEGTPAVELCQYLIKGGRNWNIISKTLKGIEDEEAAIAVMGRYLTGAMARSEDQQAKEIYVLLRAFTETTNWDKKIQLYAAVGKMLWGGMPF